MSGPTKITILEDDEGRETVAVEPIDWPVKLHTLVDNSAQIRPSLERIRQGLRELVEALPEGMAVEIVSTAPQPRFAVRMTSDLAEAREGIDRILPDSGASAFADALVETSNRIRDDDDPHFPVVLMVAGNGTDPSGGMDRKLRRLQEQTIEQPVTNHFVIVTAGRAFRGGVVRSRARLPLSSHRSPAAATKASRRPSDCLPCSPRSARRSLRVRRISVTRCAYPTSVCAARRRHSRVSAQRFPDPVWGPS